MEGLVVDALAVELERRTIVSGIGFAAPRGSVTAIVGPNGAGKSTLLRAIAGLLPLSAGTVRFDGIDPSRTARHRWARLAALVEQRIAGEAPLKVRHVVELGRIPHRSIFAQTDAHDVALVARAIHLMGLAAYTEESFARLSGGEQQRVQIARAIAQEPQLLLLDEPTNHLDIKAQLDILRFVRTSAGQGASVVLTLHELNHAAAVADQILVLHHGRLIASGLPWDVLTPALIADVYGVTASIAAHPRTGRPLLVFD